MCNRRLHHMSRSIEKQIELKAPLSRVWRALTDYREFGEWFRVKLDGPFVPGQVSRGHITYPGYEHVKWEAVVVRMEPESLFSFHLASLCGRSQGGLFEGAAHFGRISSGEERRTARGFALIESGFDKIPAGRRAEAFRMNEGGWTEQMQNIEVTCCVRRRSEHVPSAELMPPSFAALGDPTRLVPRREALRRAGHVPLPN